MNNQSTIKGPMTATREVGNTSTVEKPDQEPLTRFVESVEAMRESLEGEALAQGVAKTLGTLLQEQDWLLPEHRLGWPDRFRQHILHVAPDGGFSVVAVVWQPGQTTPIHDHLSWCVVGVYEGAEEEINYRLYENNGERFLAKHAVETAHPGEVTTLIPPEEGIHKVTNSGTDKAISIHVYAADIGLLGSSINQIFEQMPVLSDPGDARRVHWRP